MKPVKHITYKDSNMIHEQTDEVAKVCVIEAVGWVIYEDDEYITLSREIVDGDDYRGQIAIPKCAIIHESTVG